MIINNVNCTWDKHELNPSQTFPYHMDVGCLYFLFLISIKLNNVIISLDHSHVKSADTNNSLDLYALLHSICLWSVLTNNVVFV